MCFSAEASFTASVVLTGIGTASVVEAPTKRWLPFTLIPFGFAIQQAAEGILWVILPSAAPNQMLIQTALFTFLTFMNLWPFVIPLTLYWIEPDKWLQKVALAAGTIVTLVAFYILFFTKQGVQIACNSLQYESTYTTWMYLSYLSPILIATLASSTKQMFILAIGAIVGFLTAFFFYACTFTSVWCFYGAIVSVAIYWITRSNRSIAGGS